jgi:undecaprenyl-diphosphatase
MVEKIKDWDTQLFLYLNGLHTPLLDGAMYWITDRLFWVPFYLVIVLLVYKHYGLPGFWVLTAVALSVALADQFTSSLMKPYFGRLRPCYNPDLQGLVHIVRGCGGQYGFASSHASTTFALAASLWLFTREAFRYVWLMFAWAALVSYSRIYVGVHYPVDLLVGGCAGFLIAWLVYLSFRLATRRARLRVEPLPREKQEG